MKKIIIAMDYNPSAQKVAEEGYSIAKAMNAEVTLLHVVGDIPYYTVGYSPIMGYNGFHATDTVELADSLKTEADIFLKNAVKHLADADIKTIVLEGNTTDAILDYADETHADMLVMGSHSHSGLYKLVIGDTAAKVMEHCTIPMLIIPNKEEQGFNREV